MAAEPKNSKVGLYGRLATILGEIGNVAKNGFVEDGEGNIVCEKTGHAFGQAADNGDKALYKAMTGAVKYWLYKTFLVSTGDDPEQGNDMDKETAKADPEVIRRTKDWNAFQEDVAMMDTLTARDFFEDFVEKNRARMEASVYKGNYARYIKDRKEAFKDSGQRKAA
jgi:hypothetical protein